MFGSSDLIAFVPTRDPAKARKFYEETLGLEFLSEDPDGDILSITQP